MVEFCLLMSAKVAVKLRSRPKGGFGPPICRGGNSPDFGHAFSNSSYFRACDRFSLSSVQQAQRLGGEKKEERRIPVKSKSADRYVGNRAAQ